MLNVFHKKFISMATVMFTMSVISIASPNTVYQEVFNKDSIKNPSEGKRVVAIKDNPAVKHALRLETLRDSNKKIICHGWRSADFDVKDADTVIVDYYFKPETESTRYALFVFDKQGEQSVAVILENGQYMCNSLGKWRKVAAVKYGTWQHVRYVINLLQENYDFYLDDMTQAKAKGIAYRSQKCGVPIRVWTEGNEGHPSVSYFANISIKTKVSSAFPPKELAGSPFYISGVTKTTTPPVLNGKGDSKCWNNAQVLPFCQESAETKEASYVKLLWDDANLYFFFFANAADMSKRLKGKVVHDRKIWEDDCMDLFIDPNLTKKDYFHMVANAVGGVYDASRTQAKGSDVAWSSQAKMVVNKGSNSWSVEGAIPFRSLNCTPKAGDLWGFNAGRENPVTNEITSWRPLQSFHTPEMFGKIIFLDSVYQKQSYSKLIAELGEKVFQRNAMLKQAKENIKKALSNELGKNYFKSTCQRLSSQLSKCEKALSTITNFIDFYKNSTIAETLFNESQKLSFDVERMNRFFAPGAESGKRGYAVCVENSMKKIPYKSYCGSSNTKIDMLLAGREYGSSQVVLMAKPGLTFNGVAIKVSDLKDNNGAVLEGARIDSFRVDYIKTAKITGKQSYIADVLWPGTEFKFKKPLEVMPLWFDVYLPPNVKAGEYKADITITPAGFPAVNVPVTVKALPFSLPLKASLDNAFCFIDYIVENYYRKAVPKERQRDYFQFIIDHRLDPMNLWQRGKLSMSEDDLDWTEKRGKKLLFLQISKIKDNKQYYHDVIKKYDGKLKPIFFGYDEVLCVDKRRPGYLKKMQDAFTKTKEEFPHIPRLNTSHIDKRLYGYVDIWCPLFSNFHAHEAEERKQKGEVVWWYPTDYPLQPYANFNLDAPGIDPRVIPWMNWKLDIPGLLYWALNREWTTNYQDAERLTEKEKNTLGLEWMTADVAEKVKKGLRWPEVPWIPYFRSIFDKNASPSKTNGGGNMMYPGPDFQPIPSTRLKNLRDGMQDYDYFVILKNNLDQLKKQGGDQKLISQVEKALKLDDVLEGAVSYTKNPETLKKTKAKLAELIIKTQQVLKKDLAKN